MEINGILIVQKKFFIKIKDLDLAYIDIYFK